jgi:hypothetical protein
MEEHQPAAPAATDRRSFLGKAGKFAVITPPAMTILLSTSLNSPAIAASGHGGYNQGPNGGGPSDDRLDELEQRLEELLKRLHGGGWGG